MLSSEDGENHKKTKGRDGVICTQNPGHIIYDQPKHMDASLYLAGGIHFVFAWIRSLL